MANFAAADLDGLVRIVKRKLKKIQYRPPSDRRLPRRDRPDHRTLVTTCSTSSTWLALVMAGYSGDTGVHLATEEQRHAYGPGLRRRRLRAGRRRGRCLAGIEPLGRPHDPLQRAPSSGPFERGSRRMRGEVERAKRPNWLAAARGWLVVLRCRAG